MRVGRQFPLLDGVVPGGEPFFDCVGGVRYRYNLPRSILGRADGPLAVFVCMNPSSADEWHDDWTNRQIARRALEMEWRGSRLGGWNTVNLCGAIATNPRDLLRLTREGGDPLGPDNLPSRSTRSVIARSRAATPTCGSTPRSRRSETAAASSASASCSPTPSTSPATGR